MSTNIVSSIVASLTNKPFLSALQINIHDVIHSMIKATSASFSQGAQPAKDVQHEFSILNEKWCNVQRYCKEWLLKVLTHANCSQIVC